MEDNDGRYIIMDKNLLLNFTLSLNYSLTLLQILF